MHRSSRVPISATGSSSTSSPRTPHPPICQSGGLRPREAPAYALRFSVPGSRSPGAGRWHPAGRKRAAPHGRRRGDRGPLRTRGCTQRSTITVAISSAVWRARPAAAAPPRRRRRRRRRARLAVRSLESLSPRPGRLALGTGHTKRYDLGTISHNLATIGGYSKHGRVRSLVTWSDRDMLTEATAAGKLATVVSLDALAETGTRGETYADYRADRLSQDGIGIALFDAPRAELARFRTERAGLAEASPEEAAADIAQQRARRPGWMRQHAHHPSRAGSLRRSTKAPVTGTSATRAGQRRKPTCAASPTSRILLSPTRESRLRGIDGLKLNGKRQKCGLLVLHVTDPDAFATAFARGSDHLRSACPQHATRPGPSTGRRRGADR